MGQWSTPFARNFDARPAGITKEISLRKNILRHWDRLLAQSFDARLDGIVI